MQHNTNKLLSIKSLSKEYNVKSQAVRILNDINLDINFGELTIVFGPSGCGKSTLLNTILGLEDPSLGTVEVMGKQIYTYTEDERAAFRKEHIGVIYQQPNWLKSLTVIENVAFPLSLLGVPYETALQKAKKELQRVGMDRWADYIPTELSSGQQQKVSLARALTTDPKVIIADEPTGNLDYQSGLELMHLFETLNSEGKSIIMVTHNVDNVDSATQVIQMLDGKIMHVIRVEKTNLKNLKNELISIKPMISTQSVSSRPIIPKIQLKEKTKTIVLKEVLKNALQWMKSTLQFSILLSLYLFNYIVSKTCKYKKLYSFKVSFLNFTQKLMNTVESKRYKEISQVDLISLAMKNMFVKRTRTMITVGGVSIGIALIVFLVSIGYGLESLVISKVATLEEMRQLEAIPAVATNLKLDDVVLSRITSLPNVEKALPVISLVGKVSYNNSTFDSAIYGVMSDYLKESAIHPITGKIFESNEIGRTLTPEQGKVAGISSTPSKFGQEIGMTEYQIEPELYLRVRSKPTTNASVLGYTKRVEGQPQAIEVWGDSYEGSESGCSGSDLEGNTMGKWLRTHVLLWEKVDGTYTPKLTDTGEQESIEGYIAKVGVLDGFSIQEGSVLGTSTSLESVVLSQAEMASLSAVAQPDQVRQVDLSQKDLREAIVNVAFLDSMGIKENEAINKKVSLNLITTEGLSSDGTKIISSPTEYTIVGVIAENKNPVLYLPLVDAKSLGLTNYSQAKVIVTNNPSLSNVRKQVELMGLKTVSVVDTVHQIENLFGTLRLVLTLLGLVALGVASLGMFNTLTVSLLERTREIGMMKAMGMKSNEIKELLLTESMVMGFWGGIAGLFIGFLLGKMLSFFLSIFAIIQGVGAINISVIPIPLILLIVVLSFVVGIITGIFPARRATRISALNALRYE